MPFHVFNITSQSVTYLTPAEDVLPCYKHIEVLQHFLQLFLHYVCCHWIAVSLRHMLVQLSNTHHDNPPKLHYNFISYIINEKSSYTIYTNKISEMLRVSVFSSNQCHVKRILQKNIPKWIILSDKMKINHTEYA
jgi:hypothetical protein